MLRYTSAPEVTIDVHNGGSVFWETYHRVVEIESDHAVRSYTERLKASPGLGPRTPHALHGRVSSLVPGARMILHLDRADGERAATLSLVAGDGELVGEVRWAATGTQRGLLLTPDVPGALFPDPLPAEPEAASIPTRRGAPERGASVPSAAAPGPSPASAPLMVLTPGPAVDGEAFRKPWARLNRHLRRHQGRASALRLRDLSEDGRAFLARLFSGPLAALEQDALDDLRDFYAADPGRRLHVHVTRLDLPDAPGAAWRITLGEAAWGGVVIVYDVRGWDVVGRTLVG